MNLNGGDDNAGGGSVVGLKGRRLHVCPVVRTSVPRCRRIATLPEAKLQTQWLPTQKCISAILLLLLCLVL